MKYWVGIDEVGRGPIAGPVTIGLVCIPDTHLSYVQKKLKGITDSKQLTVKQREDYVKLIRELSRQGYLRYTCSSVSARIIDRDGITTSISHAIHRGLARLNLPEYSTHIFLDGGLSAAVRYSQETIIKGDTSNWIIGAASVVAKVVRDMKMVRYGKQYSSYCFEQHKGYGTKQHYALIAQHGVCPLHRKTWITGSEIAKDTYTRW